MNKLVAGVAAACAVALAWSGAAFAQTWVVDAPNPDVECHNADFPSIQAAVDAASPGDTIRVCPGIYPERVVVNKADLTIDGSGPSADLRSRDLGSDPTQESISTSRLTHFDLEAPGITLEGFTITKSSTGVLIGINSGDTIRQNFIWGDSQAIAIRNGGGDTTAIDQNVFRQNLTALSGLSSSARLEIWSNEFVSNSVAARLRAVAYADIRNNDFDSDTLGLFFDTLASNVDIVNNTFTHEGRPIELQRPQNVEVSHNQITDGRFTGIRIRAGSNVDIQANQVDGMVGGDGIVLDGATHYTTVQGNKVAGNGVDGIRLSSSNDNSLVANQVEENAGAGIAVDSGSGGNTIEQNLADNNLTFDCEDDSAGPGTGATANLWNNDLGDTANRFGICKPTGKPADTATARNAAAADSGASDPSDCVDARITDDDDAAYRYWLSVSDSDGNPPAGLPWACSPTPEAAPTG